MAMMTMALRLWAMRRWRHRREYRRSLGSLVVMALTLTVHAAVDFRNQLIGGVLVQAAISLHGILGGDEESGAGPEVPVQSL